MYKVKLKAFEGPFDLLVYLIESARMSIYDINVSEITSEYLKYLKILEDYDIEVAEEFIVLAATLIEIKSKMILPRTTIEGDVILEDDPRTSLVERLIEYKKCKAQAEALLLCEEKARNVFEKPKEDISIYLDNPDEILSLELNEFASAFKLFIDKKQRVEAVRKHYTRIERERANMVERINMILSRVKADANKKYSFREMIPNKKDRYDIVVSFMSILEMAKANVVDVFQEKNFDDIKICLANIENINQVLERYQEGKIDEQEIN